MVKDMGLENRMEYIAFSRHATKEFIRLTPKGTPVYYIWKATSPKRTERMGMRRTRLSLQRIQKDIPNGLKSPTTWA
ncbi:MAG: hypothetical protein ACLUHA_01850 [Bacteroides stercoris]